MKMKMQMQIINELVIFRIFFFVTLFITVFLKWTAHDARWVENRALGGDGVIFLACLMMGCSRLNRKLVIKIYGSSKLLP
jgi:hypothetical protein